MKLSSSEEITHPQVDNFLPWPHVKATIVYYPKEQIHIHIRGRRGRDCMVVGFTTTCAISAYRH
jgi:hypothetical protein